MNEKKNMRRISALITAQTMYNLKKLAYMAGYGDNIGRVIDKLTREKMIALSGIQPDRRGKP